MTKTKFSLMLILIAISLLVAACNPQQPDVTLTPAETQPIATEETVITALPEVTTELPISLISSELVFWSGAGSAHNQAVSGRLSALAAERGWTFEQHDIISVEQVTPTVRVIVSTANAAEIEASAAQLPAVQFLAVDVAGLNPNGNIHLVSSAGGTLEQRAFLAGYALALTTDDYRVGVISLANDDAGNRTRDSFLTGARFFCGICRARYMPVGYYPFTAEVTDPSISGDWQAAADALLASAVRSIYVQPEISSAELISYLSANNVTIVGVEGQPGLEAATRLLGVFGSDLYVSVEVAAGRLLDGEILTGSTGSLELTGIDQEIMPEGRQILFERIREELLSGMIKDRP